MNGRPASVEPRTQRYMDTNGVVHMRQSLNGCVNCQRRWSEHREAEAMTPSVEPREGSEPLTEAGRALLRTLSVDPYTFAKATEAVIAIEQAARSEASHPSVPGLPLALESAYVSGYMHAYHETGATEGWDSDAIRAAAREYVEGTYALTREVAEPSYRDDAAYIRSKGRWPEREVAEPSGVSLDVLERAFVHVIDRRPTKVKVTYFYGDIIPVEVQREAFLRDVAAEYTRLAQTQEGSE